MWIANKKSSKISSFGNGQADMNIFMWIQGVWWGLEARLGLEFFAWTTRAVPAPMDHANSNIIKYDRKSGCFGGVWQKNSLQKSVWHNVWLCVWHKTWVQLCWKSGCMTQKCMTQNVRPISLACITLPPGFQVKVGLSSCLLIQHVFY